MTRPTLFTQELADAICVRLAGGESLRKICAPAAMPAPSTVCLWAIKLPPFAEQYAHARDIQSDIHVDESIDIADKAARKPTAEKVQAARLQIDARKWQASKQKPKKYGDSMRHEGDVTLSIADKLKEARDRVAGGT